MKKSLKKTNIQLTLIMHSEGGKIRFLPQRKVTKIQEETDSFLIFNCSQTLYGRDNIDGNPQKSQLIYGLSIEFMLCARSFFRIKKTS